MRIDTPHTSIITIPASQKAILLDHLKKEAMIIPMPAAASAISSSQNSPASGAPAHHPALQVHDLGKALIEGLEVEGKRYVLKQEQQAAAKAQAQQTTSKTQSPQAPNMAGMPAMPIPPNLQQLAKLEPTVTEVWTSVKLGTAVLTKVKSSAGEQTTYCKPTSTDEPHPSLFEIPPGYKLKKS